MNVFSALLNFTAVTMRDAINLLLVKISNGEYAHRLALVFHIKVEKILNRGVGSMEKSTKEASIQVCIYGI